MRNILSGAILFGIALLLAAGCVSGPAHIPYSPWIVPGDFVATIDNPFMPLVPGTRMMYEGPTDAGLERIDYFVTRETRDVMGVTCVVVRDTVTLNGELIEDTYEWYAQDNNGNVWYFGEDSKEYKRGKVVSTTGSWEAGIDGAQPGIVMPASPTAGPSYRQEYYAGEAEDMAKVDRLGMSVTVPYGSFTGVLRTLEWTPLEPGFYEYKYYAPGVGLVLEAVRGSRERVELLSISRE
jgi:hypothetical protein